MAADHFKLRVRHIFGDVLDLLGDVMVQPLVDLAVVPSCGNADAPQFTRPGEVPRHWGGDCGTRSS